MLQNGKIKGLIFDCYKTLIDIKTDERSRETNERVSKWLLYQGVRIESERLREEYKWKIIGRLGNSGQQHPDIRIEEIFAEICAENAFKEIDPYWLGIETAKVFRTASIRKLEAYPQSLRLLKKNIKMYRSALFPMPREFLRNMNCAFWVCMIALILQLCLRTTV